MQERLYRGLIFFIGWVLSPFTWWNDPFVNLPLAYLIANILFCLTRLSFGWLTIGAYWFTNALGLFFMYFGAKKFIMSYRDKLKAALFLFAALIIYTAAMSYLDRHGKLISLAAYFGKYCFVK